MAATDDVNSGMDPQLDQALREFRATAAAAAEKPDSFWAAQRKAVLARIGQRPATCWRRPVLIWGTTLALAVIVAGLWLQSPQALPAPDFAAGYDQDLLVDVERLTKAQTPLALEPALLLADEIKAEVERRKEP